LTLTTSSGFPALVEKLDTGAVEAQRHQELPAADSLDPVGFRRVGGLLQVEACMADGGVVVDGGRSVCTPSPTTTTTTTTL
jgi:hypothetical protein